MSTTWRWSRFANQREIGSILSAFQNYGPNVIATFYCIQAHSLSLFYLNDPMSEIKNKNLESLDELEFPVLEATLIETLRTTKPKLHETLEILKSENALKYTLTGNGTISFKFDNLSSIIPISQEKKVRKFNKDHKPTLGVTKSMKVETETKEIKAPKEKKPKLQKEKSPTPFEIISKAWNENCGSLPKCKLTNKNRDRLTKQFWKQHPIEETWVQIVKAIASDEFNQGKNDRNWKASFDYMLRDQVIAKALEGGFGKNSANNIVIYKPNQKDNNV